jgi:hypothetical protein
LWNRYYCTVWCSLEILFFAGIIYGWSSLVFIFTDEGFYAELCESNPLSLIKDINLTNVVAIPQNQSAYLTNNDIGDTGRSCADQESRLGLWFSIGVGCTWTGMATLGPLSKAVGTRITRILILLVFSISIYLII